MIVIPLDFALWYGVVSIGIRLTKSASKINVRESCTNEKSKTDSKKRSFVFYEESVVLTKRAGLILKSGHPFQNGT
jgi:hypothetical protein